jgi:hypothetical protein
MTNSFIDIKGENTKGTISTTVEKVQQKMTQIKDIFFDRSN